MHLLIVSQFFYPERFILNDLANTLSKQGHRVTVLTGQPNYPDGQIFDGYSNSSRWKDRYGDITILRVPVYPRKDGKAIHLALNYLSFILSATVFGLPRLLFLKLDSIIAWGTSPALQALPAVILKIFKRKPLHFWVQDLWPETLKSLDVIKSPFLLRLIGFFVGLIYKFCDAIWVQSPGFEESVVKHGGHKDKIHWIPNWTNLLEQKLFTPDSAPQLDPQKFKILFAGNIGKAQDLDTLLEAAKIVQSEDQIQILLLGEGSEKSRLQKKVKSENIKNVVFLPGRPSNEMPYYYQQAQALAITLMDDPAIARVIPSKVQSYLASAKPIVGAVNGQAQETLLKAEAGFVGPAKDAEILAKNIKKMIHKSDEEVKQLGQNGFVYYTNHFSKEKVLLRINKLIHRSDM